MFFNRDFEIFHFSNDLVSNDDEHSVNIPLKFLPFDTFHFSNGLISDNFLQKPNIPSKYYNLKHSIFPMILYLVKNNKY